MRYSNPNGMDMSRRLSLDDTFQFKCKGCGKCCHYREDIILTPYDVYRIAGFLGRTMEEILETYCEFSHGEGTCRPLVRTSPQPPDRRCPFQLGKKCKVHPVKPLVCVSFPLARVFDARNGNVPYYVLMENVTCGRLDRTVKVRDWLGADASEESVDAGGRWIDIRLVVNWYIDQAWHQMNAEEQRRMTKFLLETFYLELDPRLPFLPQFDAAAARVYLAMMAGGADIGRCPAWLPIPAETPADIKLRLLVWKANFTQFNETVSAWGDVDNPNHQDPMAFDDHTDAQMAQRLSPEDFALWVELKEEKGSWRCL